MKKIIAIALLALMLPMLLCSCLGGDGTDDIKKTLSYPLSVSAETGELAFDLTLEAAGKSAAKMTAPRTLAGLDLQKDGDSITASYKGMTVPLPEASAKKVFALADILDAVIASFADNSYVVEAGDSASSLSVARGDAVCIVTYDNGGTVTSAEINCGGKRTVYNIIVKPAEESSGSGASSSESSNNSKDVASNAETSG